MPYNMLEQDESASTTKWPVSKSRPILLLPRAVLVKTFPTLTPASDRTLHDNIPWTRKAGNGRSTPSSLSFRLPSADTLLTAIYRRHVPNRRSSCLESTQEWYVAHLPPLQPLIVLRRKGRDVFRAAEECGAGVTSAGRRSWGEIGVWILVRSRVGGKGRPSERRWCRNLITGKRSRRDQHHRRLKIKRVWRCDAKPTTIDVSDDTHLLHSPATACRRHAPLCIPSSNHPPQDRTLVVWRCCLVQDARQVDGQ
jgi:hypothetical protein